MCVSCYYVHSDCSRLWEIDTVFGKQIYLKSDQNCVSFLLESSRVSKYWSSILHLNVGRAMDWPNIEWLQFKDWWRAMPQWRWLRLHVSIVFRHFFNKCTPNASMFLNLSKRAECAHERVWYLENILYGILSREMQPMKSFIEKS